MGKTNKYAEHSDFTVIDLTGYGNASVSDCLDVIVSIVSTAKVL